MNSSKWGLAMVLTALLLVHCSSSNKTTGSSNLSTIASITKEGLIDCFQKDLSSGGKPVWCEASAILYNGNKLLLANDKDMPDSRSSVFSVLYQNEQMDTVAAPVYLTHPLLKKASKYEDFAETPDRKFTLLSTAFDRVKAGSADWDHYNTVLYWNTGDADKPNVLTAPGHESDSTSISLRPLITDALKSKEHPQGSPYYKIEGLAATENELLFGIREEGSRYDSFQYRIKILAMPYWVKQERIVLEGSCTVLSDMNVGLLRPGPFPIAISSLEYDPYSKRFIVLTSYEQGANIGGYLWTATTEDLRHNRLIPVKNASGQIIHFTHKSEDVAIVNKNRLIIIHDDDRAALPVNGLVRKPYQAAYSVVDFQ